MSRYGHRFSKKAVTCPECSGTGENEGYFERLQAKYGIDGFGLTQYSLLCEICAGSGYLLVSEYKEIYATSPTKDGLKTFNVES